VFVDIPGIVSDCGIDGIRAGTLLGSVLNDCDERAGSSGAAKRFSKASMRLLSEEME
jgi:hypothetical protein